MPAFPAVGDPGTDTVSPPNDWASKVLAAVGASMNMTTGTMLDGVSFGTNPATAGTIRLPNNGWVAARNNANGANINMFRVTTGDVITPGAQIFRDDFASASLTTDSFSPPFLNFRRRFTNYTGSQNSAMVVHNYVSGMMTQTARGNGIVVNVDDDTAAGVTPVQNKTITAMSRVGTTVTVTSNTHGFANGDKIAIYGVTHTFNAEINGAFTVANQTANTFDVTLAGLSSGSYTSGGTVTNRPSFIVFAAGAAPAVARGGLTGTAIHGDDVVCFSAINGGTAKGTDCYYIGRNPGIAGAEWVSCFTNDANGDWAMRINGTYTYGIELFGTFTNTALGFTGTFGTSPMLISGTVTTGPVINITSTVTSGAGIGLAGSFTSYGIDFNAMTGTASLMRLKNNVAVVGRNNAGSGDVQLFYINTLDELQIAPTVRMASLTIGASNQITLGAGTNFSFATTTGTKIGTGTTQLIGFWNKTPVAQPSSTGETVGFTAGGGTTVTDASTFTGNVGSTAYRISDLVKHLKNIGLILA